MPRRRYSECVRICRCASFAEARVTCLCACAFPATRASRKCGGIVVGGMVV